MYGDKEPSEVESSSMGSWGWVGVVLVIILILVAISIPILRTVLNVRTKRTQIKANQATVAAINANQAEKQN